jgi:hypothetical protein
MFRTYLHDKIRELTSEMRDKFLKYHSDVYFMSRGGDPRSFEIKVKTREYYARHDTLREECRVLERILHAMECAQV